MADETVQFTQNQRPVLKGGQYELTVTLNPPGSGHDDRLRDPIVQRFRFTVSGDRPSPEPMKAAAALADGSRASYALAFSTGSQAILAFSLSAGGQAVYAVFPPDGSQGDQSQFLPHIILNRSTLPWEYRAISGREEIPWLALLLFDEDENPKVDIKTLGELAGKKAGGGPGGPEAKSPAFPAFELEPGQDESTLVNVIDVRREVLERIVPSAGDLKYLAHVRQGTDGQSFAVIVANRLPKPGGTSRLHLVSLESRYQDNGDFDYQEAQGADDLVRLVSLYSWRFACKEAQPDSPNRLLNLDAGMLRLPSPKNLNPDAEKYLAMGCAPLRHTTRQGNQTVSWYHGPLLPGENTAEEPAWPIRNSDKLLRFNQELGLFDVSYAAAWELGRMLALQSRAFSTELFNWKRSQAARQLQGQKLEGAEGKWAHLPLEAPAPPLALPPVVRAWFSDVARLKGLPFNYLVPDEQMLPPESIHFFFLDWLWLECLQDGAFSLGRVTTIDDALRAGLPKPSRQTTGFLLRSSVVAGWPGLQVNGARLVPVAKDISLCLFDGKPEVIELQPSPVTMPLRLDQSKVAPAQIPWRHGASSRVINIETFATEAMKVYTSDQFAQRMAVAAENVQYRLSATPPYLGKTNQDVINALHKVDPTWSLLLACYGPWETNGLAVPSENRNLPYRGPRLPALRTALNADLVRAGDLARAEAYLVGAKVSPPGPVPRVK